MKERLYRALNIKHSESSQVFDLLTVQFFIGLGNALFGVIALTLFVYNLSIHSLPLVYLAVAGSLILFNFIYEKLEHSLSSVKLLKYIIAFGGALLVVLWFGLSYGNKNDFIFILFVSSTLIYMLTGYAFWGLVSLLFNIRESRRVFSIVGAGDIPAKLIGYVAGPLLIPIVGGLVNVLWLSILAFAAGLFFFHRFTQKESWDAIKKKVHEEHHHPHLHSKKQNFINFFFKHKLIFAISLLSILSYNVFVLVDYTFISQVKLRFENITDLAVYIAIFFAIGRLIALAFKLIFTSRVIEKLGVIYCLFITPVALFLFCLIFLIYGTNPTANLYIFGLMAMLTEVLRSTMQEPVFLILFQPLKESLRLKGHIISKGYMYPPSLIIVGVSLLFLYNSGGEVTIMLAIKVVLINLCIWAAIIFFMRKTYLDTIHASIKKGIFNSDDIYITDQQTIEILLNKIAKGNKIEVIYALNILEKSGYPRLQQLFESQLIAENDGAVKKYVLERLEESGKVNVTILRKMLDAPADEELKQKVVSLLCKYDLDFLNKVSDDIDSNGYMMRKIIIISLLNQNEFRHLNKAGNEINALINSTDPLERELAVEIIGEIKSVQFSDAIRRLMEDEEIAVRRVAITAACKLRMQSLLPMVIGQIEHPSHKNIVLKGLQLYGDPLFEDLQAQSIEVPRKFLPDFIKMAGKIRGEHSTSFLLSKMEDKNVPKDKVLHSLWLKQYEPNGTVEMQKFNNFLNQYLADGVDKIKDYSYIPEFEYTELIKRSIYNEIKADLVVSLKACTLVYKKKEINRIIELVEIDKQDKLYNAMEMIELVLPKRVSKDLNILFDFILDPKHISRTVAKQEINVFFNKVMFKAPLMYNPWTKAVCVYCSWKNKETDFLESLKTITESDENLLVTETRNYVMEAIK